MKFNKLLVVTSLLALNGCSTESITGQLGTQPANHEHHADNKMRCTDVQALPSIECSDPVTATFDGNGTLWIAWVNNDHIYVQSSLDKGSHYSEPVLVNALPESVAARGENRPKIKVDTQGNIYLTWTQNLEKRHTGHIRFSRSTDGGKSFSTPITINDNQDIIGHSFSNLEIGKYGEIFVVWLDARDKEQAKAAQQEFMGSALYYAWSNDGGKSFYPNERIAPHSCECCRLATGIDADNLPVVMWRHVYDGNIRDHALVKFKDWNTPGTLRRISDENWKIDACPHHGPSLSIDENGAYHVAWFSGAPAKQGLFYGRSEDGGQTFSQPFAFGAAGAKHPSVSTAGHRVAIAWSEFDGGNNLVRLIESDNGGHSWSLPKTIGATAGSADDAFLLSDGNRIYLSWQTGQGYRFKAIDDCPPPAMAKPTPLPLSRLKDR